MKIFISHSSKDKWAAKRISSDLVALGAETFLDEKDIQTGQSIDHSIKQHLKSSDDFLIIISPASIKSEWVLIELGGAIILEKKIVPILFYVGANEIPQVINLKLARDISNIELYYNEIKSRLNGKSLIMEQIEPKDIVTTSAFKVGDKVKLVASRPNDVMRNDFLVDWEVEMDSYLGQETTISFVNPNNLENVYLLDIDSNEPQFLFAKEWLIPIK